MRIQNLNVVLVSYVVYASDECSGNKKGPVMCYECNSPALGPNNHCADPFNQSHTEIRVKSCDGACAKWLKRPIIGPTSYVRTCSSRLDMRMPVSHVCMEESRSGNGRLCFCQRDYCNHSSSVHKTATQLPLLLLSLLAVLLLPRIVSTVPLQGFVTSQISHRASHDMVRSYIVSYTGTDWRYSKWDIKDTNTG